MKFPAYDCCWYYYYGDDDDSCRGVYDVNWTDHHHDVPNLMDY